MSPTKNRTILGRMMEIMGDPQPQAFLGTATGAYYIPATVLETQRLAKTSSAPGLRKFTEQRSRVAQE